MNLVGESVPNHSVSMFSYLEKEGNPVKVLVEDIDSYPSWFMDFRKKRNKIKCGEQFSLAQLDGCIGVAFSRISGNSQIISATPDVIGQEDVVAALTHSHKICELIIQKANEHSASQ